MGQIALYNTELQSFIEMNEKVPLSVCFREGKTASSWWIATAVRLEGFTAACQELVSENDAAKGFPSLA